MFVSGPHLFWKLVFPSYRVNYAHIEHLFYIKHVCVILVFMCLCLLLQGIEHLKKESREKSGSWYDILFLYKFDYKHSLKVSFI